MTNRIRSWAMLVFMLSIPLIFTQTNGLQNSLRDVQEHYFQYLGICLFAVFLGNIWLGSFLALNIFLFINNGGVVGSMQVLNIFVACILFYISRQFFRKNSFLDFRKPIMIVTTITIVWMALQLFHIDPLFSPMGSDGIPIKGPLGDPFGIFAIKMANATYINLALPIFASFNLWMAPVLMIPILISASSSCVLSAGIVSLFYTYHLHQAIFRWLLIFAVIGTGAFLIYDYNWESNHATFNSRFPMWHATVKYAMNRPIGYGPDSFRNLTPHKHFQFAGDYDAKTGYNAGILNQMPDGNMLFQYYSPTIDDKRMKNLTDRVKTDGLDAIRLNIWDNPHSMPLQCLFEYGVLGIILFIGLTRELCIRFKRTKKSTELVVLASCLIVYYITGLTHFPLELARTAYLAPIFLGAFYACTDTLEEIT